VDECKPVAVGRRMLAGQFGCLPSPDNLQPDEQRAVERYLQRGRAVQVDSIKLRVESACGFSA
jgi:hypothetical protein